MADPAGALSARAGQAGRPAEDRFRHSDRRLAARAAQAVGERSVVAGAAASPEPVQRRPRDRASERAYERPPQPWPLALECPDGAGLARSMVPELTGASPESGIGTRGVSHFSRFPLRT